jgi:hypothetical protein
MGRIVNITNANGPKVAATNKPSSPWPAAGSTSCGHCCATTDPSNPSHLSRPRRLPVRRCTSERGLSQGHNLSTGWQGIRHNRSVIRFGIHDYQPQWLNGRKNITNAHAARLAGLVGHALNHMWLVWDLDADQWFTDAPVLLDFGIDQVEIDHQKFDDLSITWNTVDPTRAMEDIHFHLAWRPEPLPQLQALPGRTLESVELLEWASDGHDVANGSVAIGFNLTPAWLTIFNALDENGFEHHPPGPNYRRHRI